MLKHIAALAAMLVATPAALACDKCGCQDKAEAAHSHTDGHTHPGGGAAADGHTHEVVLNTTAAGSSTKGPDIVDAAVATKEFSTLVAAVKAAGLVDALKGKGPFTVFAPTNEAFERLPDETLASLLEPANKQKLTDILLYHVVPGKVMAADVVKVSAADTLLKGKQAKVRVKGKNVYVDGARVTKTDIAVSNGVIHVIDTVILPQ